MTDVAYLLTRNTMLSQVIKEVKLILPGAKLMPLFKTKDGLGPAFDCYSKDFSDLDWDAVYEDTNTKTGESFKRKPAWYAICGCKGYVIIDIDNKNGHTADSSLNRLIEQGLEVDTFIVSTKSGGYHLFFEHPGYDVKTMANFIPGVDIRGKGGYVVGFRPYQEIGAPLEPVPLVRDMPPPYFIINHKAPAELSIPLPIASKSMVLPSIDDMRLNVMPDYENMLEIPVGMRDTALLALSGKWQRLPDEEIAERFSKLRFQHVPGDEITLERLMAKIERDRSKNSKNTVEVSAYLLARFVYVLSEDKIYDFETDSLKSVPDMLNYYPAVYTYQKNEKVVSVPQVKFWLGHPDRVTVKGLRFKPGASKVFSVRGELYVNTYIPPVRKPWHQPVNIDDPDLKEFFMVIDLITNYDARVKDLYLSQRAAKLQNMLWTPSWGFVLISHHQQVGKDLTAHIFSELLGAQYCRTIKKYDLLNDRQEYNYEKLFVVLNEPGGLARGVKGLETVELLKEFMSSRKGTSRRLYQNTSDEAPIYKVPEIHSNIADSFEISEDRARYAPIIITGKPLPLEVYMRLKAKQDEDDIGCVFYRKLLRFFIDYPVNEEIQELKPPLMPDVKLAKVISKSSSHQEIYEAIANRQGLFASPFQTIQSFTLAITTHITMGDAKLAKTICRQVLKGGYDEIKEYARCRAVPVVEYDKNNIHSEVNRITLLPTHRTQMVTVYQIRELTEEEAAIARPLPNHSKVVNALFFTYVNTK